MKYDRRGRKVGLFWRHTHVHVWLFTRGTGFHYKYRRRNGLWRHVRLRLGEPSRRPVGRGTLTFELDSWQTYLPRTLKTGGGRVGLKTFVRLKLGLGGAIEAKVPNGKVRRAINRQKVRQLAAGDMGG